MDIKISISVAGQSQVTQRGKGAILKQTTGWLILPKEQRVRQKHRKKYEQAMTPTLQPLHVFSRLDNKSRTSAWTKKLRIKLSRLLVWLLELTKESIAWKRGTHIETRAKSCRILHNASCLKFNVVLISSSVERWIGTSTSYFRVVGMIRRETS